jgi:hypothetical protein
MAPCMAGAEGSGFAQNSAPHRPPTAEKGDRFFKKQRRTWCSWWRHSFSSAQLSGALDPETKFFISRSAVMITSIRKRPKNTYRMNWTKAFRFHCTKFPIITEIKTITVRIRIWLSVFSRKDTVFSSIIGSLISVVFRTSMGSRVHFLPRI